MSSMEKRNLYGYLCPASVQKKYSPLDRRIRYVGNTIGDTKLPCYLAPIIEGCHWSLCVSCPIDNVIYWFDPLGRRPSSEMRGIFNTALKTYYITGGKRSSKNGSTTWVYPSVSTLN
ncbi:uncharacterized protein LOC114756514 [Neltuma alba]|uniref:uncharacterized protein LOC114756514 n=1 Tax=Neltuma alba TaxID=207710 RepID=UPI0010A393A6|nr:uncharacterized protein LOC114756514 [Prosopis alba]